jgi:chromosome segregation ATPase
MNSRFVFIRASCQVFRGNVVNRNAQSETNSKQQMLNSAGNSGGEEVRRLEEELAQVQAMVATVRSQLAEAKAEHVARVDKITSIGNMITNLSSSAEDRAEREKQAEKQREDKAHERTEKHNNDVRMLTETMRLFEERFGTDLAKLQEDLKAKTAHRRTQQAEMKAQKEKEIDQLQKELAEKKAKFAADLAKANAETAESKRVAEDAVQRMSAAESKQRLLEVSLHTIMGL